MGYTHYWGQRKTVPLSDWADFSEGAARVFELAGVALAFEYDETETPPVADAGLVRFNGCGDDGHETFYIPRQRPPREAWQRPQDQGGGFCKTARKSYDVAVTACLVYLDSVLPELFPVNSDGRTADWEAGLALARKAWPKKANFLDIPRDVRDTDRFASYVESSKQHQLVITFDGKYVLERHSDKWAVVLPWADYDDHSTWRQALPYDQRLSGSYNSPAWRARHKGCESEACRTRALNALWVAFADHAEPPRTYAPLAA